MDDLRQLLADQRAYYEAHALEYDDAFTRSGRWNQGSARNDEWLTEWRALNEAVAGAVPKIKQDGASALDLACGTGHWTSLLLAKGYSVAAVDSSPTMIELASKRLGCSSSLAFYCEDVFDFVAQGPSFEIIMMGFWVSHVPRQLVDGFLENVADRLRVGGKALIVDHSGHADTFASTAVVKSGRPDVMARVVRDGREFTIPKVFWSLSDLAATSKVHQLSCNAVFQGRRFLAVELSHTVDREHSR